MTDGTIETQLGAADPLMRRLVRRHGPFALEVQARRTPFESLARAIASQQLNGTAAQSILNRFRKLFPGRRFPRPADLAAVDDAAIRAAGFSFAKIAALRDLAAKCAAGVVPPSAALHRLTDEEIILRLTEVRGIGRWTAEMLLMFQLGRPDVLPADDFGVRKGFALAAGLPEMPKPRELLDYGERWRPHRSAASWYLWREADAGG